MIRLCGIKRIFHNGRKERNLYEFEITETNEDKVYEMIKQWAEKHLAFDPYVYRPTLKKVGNNRWQVEIDTWVD